MLKCQVIIVNYHCAADTIEAVQSVLGTSLPLRIDVVDNSDCPQEAALLTARLLGKAYVTIAPGNLGFGRACNLAYAQCHAEYVLLLNPDARLDSDALTQLCMALDNDPGLAAVAPATWWDDARRWLLPTLQPENPIWWLLRALARRCPILFGRALARRWLLWQQRLHAAHGPQDVPALSGAVLLLRRSAVAAAGGLFDARFFMFYEDTDLCRRLRQAGFQLALLPQAHAIHHWRASAHKDGLLQESARLYLGKHFPRLVRWGARLGLEPMALFDLLAGSAAKEARWGIARLPKRANVPTDPSACGAGRAETLLAISPCPEGFPAVFRPLGAPATASANLPLAALPPGRYVLHTLSHGHLAWWAIDLPATPC